MAFQVLQWPTILSAFRSGAGHLRATRSVLVRALSWPPVWNKLGQVD
jgi:hypothetical protein